MPAAAIRSGTAAFRRTNLAMFAAGFATFALLYCVQPLMPVFAAEFAVSPAASSLVVSLTTGALAVAIIVAGTLSDSLGRKPVMTVSMLLSAVLTLAGAFVHSFEQLLVLRLLLGIALSGVPSVAMAYLGEEIAPRSVGLAIGLFIGGSAFGGMIARVATAALTDYASWRVALLAIGSASLVSGLLFRHSLPESRHFKPAPLDLKRHLGGLGAHLRDPGLPWLYVTGFLLMGSFVTVYNYAGFRLMAAPFNLGQTAVGALFTVYLVGMAASTWVGGLADRYGRRRMLWISVLVLLAGVELTRLDSVPVIVLGVAVVTIGFFGAHAVATSWITRRARKAKAQASSLYMFFYYMGSSVVGSLSGLVWTGWGWGGVATLLTLMQVVGLAIALRLAVLPPLPPEPEQP